MPEHSPGGADELRLYLVVLRCQAGDERAFVELFDRFGRRTLAYLNGLLGGDAALLEGMAVESVAVHTGTRPPH
jgi:hypothetical protein